MVVVAPVFICFAPCLRQRSQKPIDLDIGSAFISGFRGLDRSGSLWRVGDQGNKFLHARGVRESDAARVYEIPTRPVCRRFLMFYVIVEFAIVLQCQRRWPGVIPAGLVFIPSPNVRLPNIPTRSSPD